MNRFDQSKHDKEDENNARGNCTKQSKILGKFSCASFFCVDAGWMRLRSDCFNTVLPIRPLVIIILTEHFI